MIKDNKRKIMHKSLLIVPFIIIVVAGLLISLLKIEPERNNSNSYVSRVDPRYDEIEEERIKKIYRGENFLQGNYQCKFIAEDWKEHTAHFNFKDESYCEFDGGEYFYTIKGKTLKLTSIYTDTGNPITMDIDIADNKNSFKCLDGVHKNRIFKRR